MTNMKKINISEINTQNIPNLLVSSSEERESKRMNLEKPYCKSVLWKRAGAKSVIVNACSSDERKTKKNHILVNTSEVKDAMNETIDEEPLDLFYPKKSYFSIWDLV